MAGTSPHFRSRIVGFCAVASLVLSCSEATGPDLGSSLYSLVSVNGVAGRIHSNEAMTNGNRRLTYSVPLNALPGRNEDTIMVTAAGPSAIKVFRVEVRLHPGG